MSNYKQDHIVEANKKVSSVEWLSNQSYELFEQYSEGNFDRITLNKLMLKATEQAKAMHKEEISKAFEVGYVCGHRDNMESGTDYYIKEFGGNNETRHSDN
jgi:hypothetical protein